ncbi:MAG: sulfite exporter TauE/SafE family protein [Planctomycetes bacterium]|nr:sulfite exporter TauE/SafE family protein [Planctomycetota bacterium]
MLLALLGALAIGLSLGLTGSGGSILTVPVLVHVVGQPEKVAIAGSLMIVGSISLLGGVQYVLGRLVHWPSVVLFGLPGMLGTSLGAVLSKQVSGHVQLLVFESVMLLAAVFMIRPPRGGGSQQAGQPAAQPNWKIAANGLAVGGLTGFVGVGGGFLIVPALVLFGGLSMQLSVGTSLLIISLNAFSGFASHLRVLHQRGLSLDWSIIGLFVLVGVAGSIAGGYASRRIPQAALRRVFAGLLFVVAIAMIAVSLTSRGGAA